ncbi:MAG: biotin--[acetyl-CoA-carboxylase] ligase [Bacteroides sp.]|nr:biotin--[acetyl-CoA-carboxylase] ligase [Bacteroides sp.]
MELIAINEIDSTNNYLKKLSWESDLPEFTVVTTEFQTSGKGQRDNSWESAAGENLLFSFLLRPVFLPAREQFILSQLTALSIQEELDAFIGSVTIKWPNDIYWKDKKICGILIENELSGSTITESIHGVGININQDNFTGNAPNPASLRMVTGKEYDRPTILQAILHRVEYYYRKLREGKRNEIVISYQNAMYRKTGVHLFEDESGIFQASLSGVEPTGQLKLTDLAGKTRVYHFKEVRFII